MFGSTPHDLNSAPDNAFTLGPQGTDTDTKMGWVGLDFSELTSGGKSTTITFVATDLTEDPPVNTIGFEDPTLGELCKFENAEPLRDE